MCKNRSTGENDGDLYLKYGTIYGGVLFFYSKVSGMLKGT